jgi:hypothetical protein
MCFFVAFQVVDAGLLSDHRRGVLACGNFRGHVVDALRRVPTVVVVSSSLQPAINGRDDDETHDSDDSATIVSLIQQGLL